MQHNRKFYAQLLMGGAILCAPVTALAETKSAETAVATSDAGSAADAEQATDVAGIVVTALKRETNLMDTPVAISVMSEKALEDRHVQSLMDLADGAVPSLRVATFEARQSALTIGIRGIVPLDANQPAREQGVGVYVDGVYLGRQHGLGAALLDVERIEVLKGPQGTLFGRNTEGGALSLVTRKPSGDFGVRTTLGVGNLGAYNGELHLDLPKVGDFSFKIDAALQRQGAVTDNPLPGSVGWGAYDRRGLRFQVRWEPTDNFTADLSADTGVDKNTPFYSQLLNYNPNNLPVFAGADSASVPSGQIRRLPSIVRVEGKDRMTVADIGVPQQWSVDETNGAALNLSYRLNENIEFRSITAYREVNVEQWDNSGGAHRPPVFAANGNFSRYSLAGLWQHQFSQEFQAVGSMDRIDYVGGLYYFHENASDDAATPSTNKWNADGTAYTINDPLPTMRGHRFTDRASRAEAESYAVYGQATWTPAILDDNLHLTLGGRWTHDEKSGQLYTINNITPATPLSFSQENDRFDPLVTIAYDLTDDVNVYATYSTGYRAGGASSRSVTYREFGPEEVKSYELGLKGRFFDNRLDVTAAVYAMDRTGSQIDFSLVSFDPIVGASRNTLETINAPGTTEIRGVELEARWRVTDELQLSAGYAYTDTMVPPTKNPFTNVVQPVFIVFTPENAANVAVDYAVPAWSGEFRIHLDANYADATQTFDQYAVTNDSSFIVNGKVALADLPLDDSGALLTLSLWSRNLLDETFVYRRDPANRNTLGDYGNFNNPRTFGLEATVRY